jgi:tetratricopeptide (TPR) repeat protein
LLITRARNKSDRKKLLANYLEKAIENKYDIGIYLKANESLILALCCVASENEDANLFFNNAIIQVQKSNDIIFVPEFYLSRADFYLTQNQFDSALADLNSAYEIIERCGMKLYQVDYLLIHGRYSLATADLATALSHYDEAKQLIQETGYHLRDAELDLFAAQICHCTHQDLHSKNADFYLQKAKNRIEEIGQWGLMPRYGQVANSIGEHINRIDIA